MKFINILEKKINKTIMQNLFVCVLGILFICFLILFVRNPDGIQKNIFFNNMEDFFADYFNVIKYISGRDPYSEINRSSYLPLVCLLLYPFSTLDNFGSMSLEQMWESKMGLMSAFFFMAISVFFFFISLDVLRKKYNVRLSTIVILFFTGIFIFSVERGNTILLSASFVNLYLCYYDADKKTHSLAAIISLAFASVIKIYPVVLGLLYFRKRQYREIVLSALIILCLMFFPFLFFKGGFSNINLLIKNVTGMEQLYGVHHIFPRFSVEHLVYFGMYFFHFPEEIVNVSTNISHIIIIIVSLFSLAVSILIKDEWYGIILIIFVLIFYPTNSALYCGLYIFPAIVVYFSTLKNRPINFNVLILFLFIVFLCPFQTGFLLYDKINRISNIRTSVNYIICNVSLLLMWLMVLITASKNVIRGLSKHEIIIRG